MLLDEAALVVAHVDVEPAARNEPPLVERVLRRVTERDELVIGRKVGKRKAGHEPDEPDGDIAPRLQLLREGPEVVLRGRLVEASDPHVDRVDLAPADDGDDLVPQLLQLQALRDDLGVVLRHVDRALVAEEIGRVKHGDVQDVALDPLTAVEEPPEVANGTRDGDPAGVLHRVDGAHLVGDGTDAADPRGDVGRLGEMPPPEERLEEPGRLEDPELDLFDLVSLDADEHTAFPLDAREHVDAHGAGLLVTSAHGSRFPVGTPRRPR